MTSILYVIKNVPGTWQWWADAADRKIWLVPENEAAKAYAAEYATETVGYVQANKSDITPLSAANLPPLF